MLRPRSRTLILGAAVLVAAAGLLAWRLAAVAPSREPVLGVTFSTLYAKELGLDWKEAYLATLDELGVRHLRIPVYWNAIERAEGEYDWSETDWMLREAAARGAHVTLAVGRKVPRWPECHAPEWVAALPPAAQDERLMAFLAAEIEHFKHAPAVARWQVENEPLFRFGLCPPPDAEILARELALVRARDARPILLTDSGELSAWRPLGRLSDTLGISLYRLVWNDGLGQIYWPVPPSFYTDRIRFLAPAGGVIVSELQAEPWFHESVEATSIELQLAQMNPRRLHANVAFAKATGVSDIYLWGVEWWYWLLKRDHPELWEAAKAVFKK